MTVHKYSNLSIILHWMTFIIMLPSVIVAAFWFHVFIPANDPNAPAIISLHMSAGLTIWVLALARLVVRFTRGVPEPVNSNRLMAIAERGMHFILYAGLLILPLIALAGVWIRGRPFVYFGMFSIPSPIKRDWPSPTGKWLDHVHKDLATIFLLIIAAHALAALYHYTFKGAEVSPRMQIGARRKQA